MSFIEAVPASGAFKQEYGLPGGQQHNIFNFHNPNRLPRVDILLYPGEFERIYYDAKKPNGEHDHRGGVQNVARILYERGRGQDMSGVINQVDRAFAEASDERWLEEDAPGLIGTALEGGPVRIWTKGNFDNQRQKIDGSRVFEKTKMFLGENGMNPRLIERLGVDISEDQKIGRFDEGMQEICRRNPEIDTLFFGEDNAGNAHDVRVVLEKNFSHRIKSFYEWIVKGNHDPFGNLKALAQVWMVEMRQLVRKGKKFVTYLDWDETLYSEKMRLAEIARVLS